MSNNLDFLAIGDIVTDAFIRINDAEVICDANGANCKLAVRFGDKVPYESVEEVRAVGNSANAAVAAARLGLSSGLITHVGKDLHGEEAIAELKKNNVDASYIGVHDNLPTNYHYVLWHGVDRTILVKHQAFPYSLPPELPAPKMLYLSSLGDHSFEYHKEIVAYVRAHPEMKLVFQPGTFQMKIGTEALADIYSQTYAFFCNVEEAQRILGTAESNVGVLMNNVHALGPKLVFITDGIKGAYASDGTEQWFMPVYPQEPYERTGAGDAFASTVAAALLLGLSIPDALRWGPVNSMSVVQQVGAQKGLLTREALEQYLTEAPADYQPQKLS